MCRNLTLEICLSFLMTTQKLLFRLKNRLHPPERSRRDASIQQKKIEKKISFHWVTCVWMSKKLSWMGNNLRHGQNYMHERGSFCAQTLLLDGNEWPCVWILLEWISFEVARANSSKIWCFLRRAWICNACETKTIGNSKKQMKLMGISSMRAIQRWVMARSVFIRKKIDFSASSCRNWKSNFIVFKHEKHAASHLLSPYEDDHHHQRLHARVEPLQMRASWCFRCFKFSTNVGFPLLTGKPLHFVNASQRIQQCHHLARLALDFQARSFKIEHPTFIIF